LWLGPSRCWRSELGERRAGAKLPSGIKSEGWGSVMSTIGEVTSRWFGRVALPGLLAALVASCGAEGAETKSDPRPQNTGTARAAPRPLLDGDGIGGVKFGQPPEVVAASLGRLFGPPVGAHQIRNGYLHGLCGFYWGSRVR
jgi:hypothetical protein